MITNQEMSVRHLRALGVYHYEMALQVFNNGLGKLPSFNTWVAHNQELLNDAKNCEQIIERLNRLTLMLPYAKDAMKYLRALKRKLEK